MDLSKHCNCELRFMTPPGKQHGPYCPMGGRQVPGAFREALESRDAEPATPRGAVPTQEYDHFQHASATPRELRAEVARLQREVAELRRRLGEA